MVLLCDCKLFARVSTSGLMKILCTIRGVCVACCMGNKGSKGVPSSGWLFRKSRSWYRVLLP